MARRKTNNEFTKEVYELVGDEYVFLEEYVNNYTKILCKHIKCGHEYYAQPNNFLNGKRCPNCYGIKKLTYKEVKYFIETESNSGCKLLSKKYKNSTERLLLKCKCGNDFKTTFDQFKHQSKRQCNDCGFKINAQKRSISYDKVKSFIEIESSSGCKLLSKKYTNAHSNLKIKCKCGRFFQTTYNTFRLSNKRQCDTCTNDQLSKKYSKGNEWFLNEVRERFGTDYLVLGEYINAKTKVKIKHLSCGYVWDVWADHFLNSNGCIACSGYKKKTTNDFKLNVHELNGDEYSVTSKYVNAHTSIKMHHNLCGNSFYIKPNTFLSLGNGCPYCKTKSKGEKLISDILDKYSICYEVQYSFDDCRNERVLLFDFYLPDYNLLIEYDGEHHFSPVDFAGKGEEWAKELFGYTQHNDQIKSQYCKDNNIPLLRIPYWDLDNIEKILKNHLNPVKMA